MKKVDDTALDNYKYICNLFMKDIPVSNINCNLSILLC